MGGQECTGDGERGAPGSGPRLRPPLCWGWLCPPLLWTRGPPGAPAAESPAGPSSLTRPFLPRPPGGAGSRARRAAGAVSRHVTPPLTLRAPAAPRRRRGHGLGLAGPRGRAERSRPREPRHRLRGPSCSCEARLNPAGVGSGLVAAGAGWAGQGAPFYGTFSLHS